MIFVDTSAFYAAWVPTDPNHRRAVDFLSQAAERLVALPGDSRIERKAGADWKFPEGAVLVQTLSLPQHRGDSGTSRKIETRLLKS